jgi:hypothetical protein
LSELKLRLSRIAVTDYGFFNLMATMGNVPDLSWDMMTIGSCQLVYPKRCVFPAKMGILSRINVGILTNFQYISIG